MRKATVGLLVLALMAVGCTDSENPTAPLDPGAQNPFLDLAATVEGAPCEAQATTYTTDADFDNGTLVNVNHDIADQLQLDDAGSPFNFIWVAASARGTIVKIDTKTGAILGEYHSAPSGRGLNPSRTTVDANGNVWSGNRNENGGIPTSAHGSVVKIGLLENNQCVDRNTDGVITTSSGLGDILAWPDITDGVGSTDGNPHVAQVQDAVDECILLYQRTPDADAVRHVSVDANNDVWIGGYPFSQRSFHKLDGEDGSILDGFDARRFGCGGYGGLIDGDGILWSASLSQNKLLRYDPGTDTGVCIPVSRSYGLGLDNAGFIWNSMWINGTIMKVSPAGVIQAGFPQGTGGNGSRGVAVTADNHVWVANSGSNTVTRLDNSGILQNIISVGTVPTGVAVDADGKVWTTNINSNNVMRIDPATNAVDLTVGLGAGAGPYNYSDMTGAITPAAPTDGNWTVVQDGGVAGNPWTAILWTGDEPDGTSITVSARAADAVGDLGSQPWTPVTTSGQALGLSGQYIEVRVQLHRDDSLGPSPVLYDLTIRENCPPVADPNGPYLGAVDTDILFDGTDSSDPDGDPLTYDWNFGNADPGTGPTPTHNYAAPGIYDVCLIVNDGFLDSEEVCTIAVIYDPDGGFVTGGGWIMSPEGAYMLDPFLVGKANFGFVAKYKKGQSTPDGNTEFQFHAAGMNFHSTDYDWLVITQAGTNAQFKGTGTINGMGDYKFMLWAGDKDPDTFRIKIWEEDGGGVETVVYDNEYPGQGDQPIEQGSIVIHTKGKK